MGEKKGKKNSALSKFAVSLWFFYMCHSPEGEGSFKWCPVPDIMWSLPSSSVWRVWQQRHKSYASGTTEQLLWVLKGRALLRHRPIRPGPRASHKWGPPTSKVARNPSINQHHFLVMHAIFGWPLWMVKESPIIKHWSFWDINRHSIEPN